jgi:hypothetical protein
LPKQGLVFCLSKESLPRGPVQGSNVHFSSRPTICASFRVIGRLNLPVEFAEHLFADRWNRESEITGAAMPTFADAVDADSLIQALSRA